MPSVEELNARAKVRSDDRRVRSSRDLFNPFNLGHWLDLCVRANVPAVPAEEIARIAVDDALGFDTPEHQVAVAAFYAEFEAGMAARGEQWMARWSCCAGSEIKMRLSEGDYQWHPDMVRFFSIDDPRAYDIIYDYPEESVAVYARPWAKAAIFDSHPVEYRVFVTNDQIDGIANYYPQRALPNDKSRLNDIARCYAFVWDLLRAQRKPLNAPRLEAHWDITKNHWTADFIRLADGRLLFLEGGPPHTPNGGAHPCCFIGRAISGIALAASSDGLDAMGLAPASGTAAAQAAETLGSAEGKGPAPQGRRPS